MAKKGDAYDAYFLKARMVRDEDLLRREFVIDETIKSGLGLYVFKFLPKYGRTFVKCDVYKRYVSTF